MLAQISTPRCTIPCITSHSAINPFAVAQLVTLSINLTPMNENVYMYIDKTGA